MPLTFSNFYKFDQLASINLGGSFSTTWDGQYHKTTSGTEPNPGSGLTSGSLRMLDANLLPQEIQALLQRKGLIYIFISTTYHLLYVGISTGNLKSGVFGPGRFSHHVRKLLAALGGGTNHTGGWTAHAVDRYGRYRDFVRARQPGGVSEKETASHLLGDWRFAFASCDSPDQHEGWVLDSMASQLCKFWSDVTILNTGHVKSVPVDHELPPNLHAVVRQAVE